MFPILEIKMTQCDPTESEFSRGLVQFYFVSMPILIEIKIMSHWISNDELVTVY